MRTTARSVATLVAFFAGMAMAMAQSAILLQRLDQVGALTRPMAVVDESLFTKEFLAAVPPDKLVQAIRQLTSSAGSYVTASITAQRGDHACTGALRMSGKVTVPVELTLESAPPHRIAGLFLRPPVPDAASVNDVVAELRALPGRTALAITNLSTGVSVASYGHDVPMPLGSSFKLFVLGELVRSIKGGQRAWTDVVPLDSARRSYPSGEMHTWPHGSPVTLHTLALKMISISDNTATDALIRYLGRTNIEQVQQLMGNTSMQRNIPFLTTREFFQLKFSDGGDRARRYLRMKPSQRRIMLDEELHSLHYDDVQFTDDVILPDSVEWFASMQDMVTCMDWFRRQSENEAGKPALSILGINPGITIDSATWPYVGFKGGSESGVVCLVYLLRHRSGEWYGVSAAWVNPSAAVDAVAFAGKVQRLVELIP